MPEQPPRPPGDHSAPPPPGGANPPLPPPPPGGYPPPPPAAGGPVPPAPGPLVRALPPEAYVSWFTRVLAFLIDSIPYGVIIGGGFLVLFATQQTACITDVSPFNVAQYCATGFSPVGMTAMWLAALAASGYLLWNYGYRQGTTGSSIGKSVLRFRVVSENTGEPIGFALSILRAVAHCVDVISLGIGLLFPLWDPKRQTLADKIMSTVCLPIRR
ncbi:MAG: RDD family protein [Mycobacterium sp.]|uniref:RDD family protein n=1 Tax=Mycobacterium sp. TaxID=1785 RepID=UPI0026031DDA|nr:RDD family protein [Mycobacterium sp.]MDI3315360.1 RDD family protein [Mycobacterium sp.]